ncbi:hypothetical protein BJ166DRAFT_346945 [Pestalotiopsis sp. NC0098]|nr:hypothetical protein BJ166DRAFT_346945 [Pestalotiopsis sp. NC0098]KAI4596991.1 hypothetical protein KJ359_004901 [Pestalotiopsis sp. 9143b]
MQFFALITLALSAVVSAELTQVVRRQVPVSEAAMTDASGNIVSYNAAGVYKAATSQGL